MAVDVNNKISVLISSFLAVYKSCYNYELYLKYQFTNVEKW